MTMEAQQIHFRYSAEEDRIMAFVKSESGGDHVFELTRRVLKALWPELAARVGAMSKAVRQAPEHARKEVLEFEQEGAMMSAQQTGAVATTQERPVADRRSRYLVRRVQMRDHPSGAKILHLSDGKTSLNLPLTVARLRVICELLRSIAEQAQWDLDLSYGMETQRAPRKEAESAQPLKSTRRLH